MRFKVFMHNTSLDYNFVKNNLLTNFKIEDINPEEGEFYIWINIIEEVIEISNELGLPVKITTFCDEPIIEI